jgi:hypothetical protein
MGHIARECPSKHTYIATDDGGYVSASDEDNEFGLAIDTTAGKYEDTLAMLKRYLIVWHALQTTNQS